MIVLMTLTLLIAAEQPIPFSHKQHAGALKLACKTCHRQPDPDGPMTLPAEAICASCHAQTPSEKTTLQRLQVFLKEKRNIPWQRVYELPTYVFWSHTAHRNAGATCEKCHGPVAEREVLTAEINHKMADCIACHRASKAPTDCAYCHEQRN